MVMCGQAGYSMRSSTETFAQHGASSPSEPSGLEASSALSSFMQPDTTVLYCMRSKS
jgi:hypothetical protein